MDSPEGAGQHIVGGAYVTTFLVGMYAPVATANESAQTCQTSARLRHPAQALKGRSAVSHGLCLSVQAW